MNIGVAGNAGCSNTILLVPSMDFKVKNDGVPKTALRIDSNLRLGVNNIAPDEALDVTGNILASGTIRNTSTTNSTSFSTGAIRTAGGLGVAQDINVGGNAEVTGTVTTSNIEP